jgi:hypothetical protein
MEVEEMLAAGTVVRLAPAGPQKFMNRITEAEDPKEISLFLCRQTYHQRGRNEPLQTGVVGVEDHLGAATGILLPPCETGTESRGVDGHIDLLGPLYLENLGDGMAALGGGLPVDFIVAVARDIFAQFLEILSLAVLTPDVNAVAAPVEEECGQISPFLRQIGVNPDLACNFFEPPAGPEAQGRLPFEITRVDVELTALQRCTGPHDTQVFSALWYEGEKVFLRTRNFARKGKSQA